MHGIKVTHTEVQDFSVRLGSDICISRVENPMGTLSSSLCQTLNKETVGLIPVIRVWLTTLELDSLLSTVHLGPCSLSNLIINQPSVADHYDQ